jgi:hypothetical protein
LRNDDFRHRNAVGDPWRRYSDTALQILPREILHAPRAVKHHLAVLEIVRRAADHAPRGKYISALRREILMFFDILQRYNPAGKFKLLHEFRHYLPVNAVYAFFRA